MLLCDKDLQCDSDDILYFYLPDASNYDLVFSDLIIKFVFSLQCH